ncbi:MAG: histidinol-phosphatase HisJ family protein [Verrucomicrobiota bacterium]|nr:histidinol-phosphatase HisJ family protein [Verrucomicrobiota bacterium]
MSIKSLHDCQLTRYYLPMALPADYHMHTPLCRHAKGEPSEYAARALELGLPEIGFSDHSPVEHDDQDDWRMLADELAQYVTKVEHARETHPALPIRLGLEVDFIPGHESWIKEMARRHDWDYFIGSVHYISGKWDFDNPKRLAEWAEHDVDEVWADYFTRLTTAAASGLFQIIGHPDLPKKFGHRPQHDPTSLYMDFLAACESTGTCIELNTAGLRRDCAEIYPNFEFLQLAKSSNVQITFGSDAHSTSEVGMNLEDATTLAREAGYKQCCRFNRLEKDVVKF